MMKAWYKLDDKLASKVEVKDDADVDDLRDAIKAKWGDRLRFAAPDLMVFAAGVDPTTTVRPLEPFDPVPINATGQNPLIVVTPQGKFRFTSRRASSLILYFS